MGKLYLTAAYKAQSAKKENSSSAVLVKTLEDYIESDKIGMVYNFMLTYPVEIPHYSDYPQDLEHLFFMSFSFL